MPYNYRGDAGNDNVDGTGGFNENIEKTDGPGKDAPHDGGAKPDGAGNGGNYAFGRNSKFGNYDNYYSEYSRAWNDPVYKAREEGEDNVYSPNYRYSRKAQYAEPVKAERRRPKKIGLLSVAVLLILCILISTTTSFFVINYAYPNLEPTKIVIGSPTRPPAAVEDPEGKMSGSEIYDLACQQVVGVKTTVPGSFGMAQASEVKGSGFVISEDGYILTNYHVIEYAAQYGYELTVVLQDDTGYRASIIGYEKNNDVAVIKIDVVGLNAVTLGKTEDVFPGQQVYVVGNPLGNLAYSMSGGLVSALDRNIRIDSSGSGEAMINMFQIDAAVNSGNSGGPVYNGYGEVIGIVTAKYSREGVEGLGFALPIDDVIGLSKDIIETGQATGKAYLGIRPRTVSKSVAEYYDWVEGVYVLEVIGDTPAARAGIKVGDIIYAVGDDTIDTAETLDRILKKYKAGDAAQIKIFRGGEHIEVGVEFEETN